jgi:ribosomal protein S13
MHIAMQKFKMRANILKEVHVIRYRGFRKLKKKKLRGYYPKKKLKIYIKRPLASK